MSQLFLLNLFLIFSFLPKLTVSETKVAGQRLSSSRLFWLANGPYWQHWGNAFASSLMASDTKCANLTLLPLEIMYRGHTRHDYP